MLTLNQSKQICIDFVLGNPLPISGPEVDMTVESLKKDIEKAKKNGYILSQPFDLTEDLDDLSDDDYEYVFEPGDLEISFADNKQQK